MEIDIHKINNYIENVSKPAYLEVPEEEFRNALMGAQEAYSNTDLDSYDTERLWTLIFFSAVYFCKGMMWAETKAGLREETLYPRY